MINLAQRDKWVAMKDAELEAERARLQAEHDAAMAQGNNAPAADLLEQVNAVAQIQLQRAQHAAGGNAPAPASDDADDEDIPVGRPTVAWRKFRKMSTVGQLIVLAAIVAVGVFAVMYFTAEPTTNETVAPKDKIAAITAPTPATKEAEGSSYVPPPPPAPPKITLSIAQPAPAVVQQPPPAAVVAQPQPPANPVKKIAVVVKQKKIAKTATAPAASTAPVVVSSRRNLACVNASLDHKTAKDAKEALVLCTEEEKADAKYMVPGPGVVYQPKQ